MMIMTTVANIPPKVDKALAVGPINFNPPNMINNGIPIDGIGMQAHVSVGMLI